VHARGPPGRLVARKTSTSGSCSIRLEDKHAFLLLQGVTDGWAAQRDWVLPDGGVDTEFLARSFGDSNVTATDTSRCLCAFAVFAPVQISVGVGYQVADWTWHQLKQAEPA
jgi:hypothetical protein